MQRIAVGTSAHSEHIISRGGQSISTQTRDGREDASASDEPCRHASAGDRHCMCKAWSNVAYTPTILPGVLLVTTAPVDRWVVPPERWRLAGVDYDLCRLNATIAAVGSGMQNPPAARSGTSLGPRCDSD